MSKKPYEGKDGLARDLGRMRYEFETKIKPVWESECIPEYKAAKWYRKPHKALNFVTEACRASAFWATHVWAAQTILTVALIPLLLLV